ncbi:MAG TPA: hypothetical protein VG798_05190 [Rhizomicrobium sp.]|nr:hypothetical protein [Rhizomicrobium sp.]
MAKITIVAVLIAVGIVPAAGRDLFAGPPAYTARNYPGAPRPVINDNLPSPYAMTYTDEAVQSLGFRNGHMDVFSTKPAAHSFWPSFSGGIGGDGAMLKLQWRSGQ